MKSYLLILSGLIVVSLNGCDNLAKGTRLKPLEETKFSNDGQSALVPPPHSVARGQLRADTLLYTGRNPDGTLATRMPWPVNAAVLARGRTEYGAVCASCHAPDGYGQGIIVRRGFPQPPSLHNKELTGAPIGHFFDVITNGHGAMFPYASIVTVEDRWAIAAYIRALQRSQQATTKDVPPEKLTELSGGPTP